jgi:hypothetical protein
MAMIDALPRISLLDYNWITSPRCCCQNYAWEACVFSYDFILNTPSLCKMELMLSLFKKLLNTYRYLEQEWIFIRSVMENDIIQLKKLFNNTYTTKIIS